MNRRAFLAAFSTAAAAIAFDPERALWAPGKKLISIPRPRLVTAGWTESPAVLKVGDIVSFPSYSFIIPPQRFRITAVHNPETWDLAAAAPRISLE